MPFMEMFFFFHQWISIPTSSHSYWKVLINTLKQKSVYFEIANVHRVVFLFGSFWIKFYCCLTLLFMITNNCSLSICVPSTAMLFTLANRNAVSFKQFSGIDFFFFCVCIHSQIVSCIWVAPPFPFSEFMNECRSIVSSGATLSQLDRMHQGAQRYSALHTSSRQVCACAFVCTI